MSELALSNTNEIRYSRVGTGKLKSANRYALVNDKTGYMMSYNPVAVKPGVPNRILSLTQTTSGDAWKAEGQNSYYYKADGDKVYLDHSNRSLATIVIRQGTLATNASFSTSGNNYSKLFSGSSGKIYEQVWLAKATKGDNSENWWNAIDGQDGNNPVTQYRYLDFRYAPEDFFKTSRVVGTDNKTAYHSYIIEDMGDGYFLIYWRNEDGSKLRFLTCDEQGSWGVKLYSASSQSACVKLAKADLASLKLRIYSYELFSTDTKELCASGASVFNVEQGTTLGQLESYIQRNITVTDGNSRKYIPIPCSGTEPKVGYYYLKFDHTYDSSGKSYQTYTVSLMYRNDDKSDTELTKLTVNVLERDLQFEGDGFGTFPTRLPRKRCARRLTTASL